MTSSSGSLLKAPGLPNWLEMLRPIKGVRGDPGVPAGAAKVPEGRVRATGREPK
jgi:hypothetical protein